MFLVCVCVQSRKLEKQVERLKVKASQQAEDIERLKAECDEMASLKVYCSILFRTTPVTELYILSRLSVMSRRVR